MPISMGQLRDWLSYWRWGLGCVGARVPSASLGSVMTSSVHRLRNQVHRGAGDGQDVQWSSSYLPERVPIVANAIDAHEGASDNTSLRRRSTFTA